MSALPRTRLGWLGAALAVLLFGALVADVAHRSAVDHTVCAEHGELIHVAAAPILLAEGACAIDGGERASAAPLERDDDAHEHCLLGALQREQVCRANPALELVGHAPPSVQVGVPRNAIRIFRAEPLILLAPKQSPPA